jgi:prepilin-type N-terminal cleavage/methylation domain-containing protein
MRISQARLCRPGFTLIEMVVVLAALGVCVFMGAALVITMLKAEHTARDAANHVSRRQALAALFRNDVARAESADPFKIENLSGQSTRLLLQIPGGTTVLYHWGNEALERIERMGAKETRKVVYVGGKGSVLYFLRSFTRHEIITLCILESSDPGPLRQSDVSAALGGNLR